MIINGATCTIEIDCQNNTKLKRAKPPVKVSYLISKCDQCTVNNGIRCADFKQIKLSTSKGMFSSGLYRPVFRPLCSLCKRVCAVLADNGKRQPSENSNIKRIKIFHNHFP